VISPCKPQHVVRLGIDVDAEHGATLSDWAHAKCVPRPDTAARGRKHGTGRPLIVGQPNTRTRPPGAAKPRMTRT
jgi:hypothetical protein